MSNVHLIQVENDYGELIAIAYYHHGCAPIGTWDWPAPEALDYPVYCDACGERIESVPLTAEGRRYVAEQEGARA